MELLSEMKNMLVKENECVKMLEKKEINMINKNNEYDKMVEDMKCCLIIASKENNLSQNLDKIKNENNEMTVQIKDYESQVAFLTKKKSHSLKNKPSQSKIKFFN